MNPRYRFLLKHNLPETLLKSVLPCPQLVMGLKGAAEEEHLSGITPVLTREQSSS